MHDVWAQAYMRYLDCVDVVSSSGGSSGGGCRTFAEWLSVGVTTGGVVDGNELGSRACIETLASGLDEQTRVSDGNRGGFESGSYASVDCGRGVGVVGDDESSVNRQFGRDCGDGVKPRGKWYKKNKAKKFKAMARGGSGMEWRKTSKPVGDKDDVVVDRCETIYSSGASTLAGAEEEARKTLALRRVAENRVAIVKAEALVASYADEAKSEALQELAALRIAQRANEARAKSQSSWKKCEESLGSLGSTGSAGEFWMKREVEKGKQWEKKYLQLKKQSEHMYASATQQVRDELLAMDGTITTVGSDCMGDSENIDDYLAQNVGAAEKDLATMEDEFRNFKF